MVELPKCACGCGADLSRTGRSGPAPRYASPACRMRASRRRRAPELEPYPDQAPPVEVRIVVEKLEDQIAQAILEARAIGFAFQRLGTLAPAQLAWRCTTLSTSIITELNRLFPTERQNQ